MGACQDGSCARAWPEYHPAYYATFFLDPDGFRVEISAARDARL